MESPRCDPVTAALHLAAEDDAFTSRSTVELPVAAFSKRLDNCVNSARGSTTVKEAASHKPQDALNALAHFIFRDLDYHAALPQMLELYSPYRIYMQKVRLYSDRTWPACTCFCHALQLSQSRSSLCTCLYAASRAMKASSSCA